MSSPIIEIQGLSKNFAGLTALKRLDLQIEQGEVFGLVGPDGAGKTTTLRLLSGLLTPSEGKAMVAGFDVESESQELRDQLGYMAQRFGLYLDLTVAENMSFYSDLFDVSGQKKVELSEKLLRMTRMKPFRHRRAGKLSGGMKQKLGLMCALLHEPEILFLDEPTNGVDPISRRDFWVILYQLVKSGITVVVTTAYLDEAERCNRVGLLYRGELIECDTPDKLVEDLPEECFRLSVLERRKVREILVNEEGVLSAEPSGPNLHVFVSPDLSSLATLEKCLREKGVGEFEFEKIRPSIEDVFIALIRKRERIQ